MANTARRLQTNLNGGELSPFVEGRPDLAKFFTGARVVENFLLQVEGGAFFRYGTRYIGPTKWPDKKVILATFSFNTTNEYLLEIGDQYIRIYRNGVRIQQESVVELVTNGGFDSNIVGWEGTGIEWEAGTLKLVMPGTPVAYQAISTVIGQQYTLRFDVVSNEVLVFAKAGVDLLAPFDIFGVGVGHAYTFTAVATTTYVGFWWKSGSTGFANVDNVSVRIPMVSALEIATPWIESDLKDLQWKQSADVLYFVHPRHQQRKLSRLSDTNWQFGLFTANPPPTFTADEDISEGTATLTPQATSGTGVTFNASQSVFLAGDVGRLIVSGASKATITSQTGNACVADIIDDFPNTTAIQPGEWFLRLAPQTTLDADTKGPVGANIGLSAGTAAFRSTVVGRYIRIWDGLVKVTGYTSATAISGIIMLELSGATNKNPAVADEGTWVIESEAWSDALGWPRAIEFHQGRLWFGYGLPATIAGSASDDFENFATGVNADNAVVYGIKSVNPISWLISLRDLFIGDPDKERSARGPGVDEPLGGDVIPYVSDEGDFGAMHCLPLVVNRAVLFIKEIGRRLVQLAYDWEANAFSEQDLNVFSRHLTDPYLNGSPFVQHPPVYVSEPNQLVWMPREDGQACVLAYYRPEQVYGWSRQVTQGKFLSFAAVRAPDNTQQQVYTLAQRTINGETKTYIEVFEDRAAEIAGMRPWAPVYTDSCQFIDKRIQGTLTLSDNTAGVGRTATVSIPVFSAAFNDGLSQIVEVGGTGRAQITTYVSPTQVLVDILDPFTTTGPIAVGSWAIAQLAFSGFDHLEALDVAVVDVVDGYLGTFRVTGGVIVIGRYVWLAEVGLPYTGTIQTMRPSMQNAVVEGLMRRWSNLQLRLVRSFGGQVNGYPIIYPPGTNFFTGDTEKMNQETWDTEGYITITQNQPAPLNVVSVFGNVEFGDG